MAAWYLDSSAAAKLVVEEAHSRAFRAWASRDDVELVASDLTRTELTRAVRRKDESLVAGLAELWKAVDVVRVPAGLLHAAAALDPRGLRTLDALHLAVALDLGDGLAGVTTYDARLADAAAVHGLEVIAPGL